MVLAITSSGRRGANSTALALAALSAVDGAKKSHFDLSKLRFTGCTGCGGCRSGAPGCVIRDDLTPILEGVAKAQGLILAAPVYYGYVSGIFKSFLDRWYGFRDGDKTLRIPSGRPLLMILAQGHPDPTAYGEMAGNLDKIYTAYGFLPRSMIAAGIEGPDSLGSRPDLVAEASSLGAVLAEKLKRD